MLEEALDAGLRGAMIGTQPKGATGVLDDPDLDPFWEVASARKATLFIHPTFGARDDRLKAYGMVSAVGRVTDTSIAVARLLFSGHLKRYPGVKLVLSHGGAALPMLFGRLRRSFETTPADNADPIEGFKSLYFDTVVYDPRIVRFVGRDGWRRPRADGHRPAVHDWRLDAVEDGRCLQFQCVRARRRCRRHGCQAFWNQGLAADRIAFQRTPHAMLKTADKTHSSPNEGSSSSSGIGQHVLRKEDLRLVVGKGRYTDDLALEGQTYAIMVRSPHAHARIRGIDATAALAMPGVIAVLSGRDLIEDGVLPVPHKSWSQHPAEVPLVNKSGAPVYAAAHHALPPDKARFVGEAIAMVIADSVANAKDAAEAVNVDYEVLPAVIDAVAAASPDAPRLWEDEFNVLIDGEVGDAAATARLSQKPAYRAVEDLDSARRRRADGAARGASANTTPRRRATRSTPAAATP